MLIGRRLTPASRIFLRVVFPSSSAYICPHLLSRCRSISPLLPLCPFVLSLGSNPIFYSALSDKRAGELELGALLFHLKLFRNSLRPPRPSPPSFLPSFMSRRRLTSPWAGFQGSSVCLHVSVRCTYTTCIVRDAWARRRRFMRDISQPFGICGERRTRTDCGR